MAIFIIRFSNFIFLDPFYPSLWIYKVAVVSLISFLVSLIPVDSKVKFYILMYTTYYFLIMLMFEPVLKGTQRESMLQLFGVTNLLNCFDSISFLGVRNKFLMGTVPWIYMVVRIIQNFGNLTLPEYFIIIMAFCINLIKIKV